MSDEDDADCAFSMRKGVKNTQHQRVERYITKRIEKLKNKELRNTKKKQIINQPQSKLKL